MLRAELRGAPGGGGPDLDVSLTAAAGECVALAGPSGAGKTTVLRAIAGLTRPASALVACGEETWTDTAAGLDVPPERRGVGLVFQDHALFPHLSAWRNVAYGLRGVPRATRRSRAEQLLDDLGVGARSEAAPRELSGGERQRVALARALAPGPRALLLDEPLSSLDPRARAGAAALVARVVGEAGVPAVLVTHDFAEAARLATRVLVVDRGRVVQEGTPSELAARPASAFVADFTGAVVLTGIARPQGELTALDLDGGGTVLSTDRASGRAAAIVHPWEIALEPVGASGRGSPQNRLAARVASVTRLGGRVRVGLDCGQALTAEITPPAAQALALAPGAEVVAVFKAAATRLTGS